MWRDKQNRAEQLVAFEGPAMKTSNLVATGQWAVTLAAGLFGISLAPMPFDIGSVVFVWLGSHELVASVATRYAAAAVGVAMCFLSAMVLRRGTSTCQCPRCQHQGGELATVMDYCVLQTAIEAMPATKCSCCGYVWAESMPRWTATVNRWSGWAVVSYIVISVATAGMHPDFMFTDTAYAYVLAYSLLAYLLITAGRISRRHSLQPSAQKCCS
jgi:hypothetical protein